MQGDPNNFSIVPGGNSLHLSVREGSSPKASGKKGRDFTCCRNHMKGLGNQVFSVCKKARKGLQMHFISLKSRKNCLVCSLFIFQRQRIYSSLEGIKKALLLLSIIGF